MWLNYCLSRLAWIRTVLDTAVLFLFFFLCSTPAMLRHLKFDTGGLAVAAAWLAFHHLFF
jgi:hypothetical protein